MKHTHTHSGSSSISSGSSSKSRGGGFVILQNKRKPEFVTSFDVIILLACFHFLLYLQGNGKGMQISASRSPTRHNFCINEEIFLGNTLER